MAQTSIGTRMAAGVTAAAVALGVTQLAAAFFSPAADARTAVGTSVINLTPGPIKEWAIQTFGTNDKTFLTVMVVVVISALIAAAASGNPVAKWLGLVGVALASVNIFGGFAVTARMLAMYKKKERS